MKKEKSSLVWAHCHFVLTLQCHRSLNCYPFSFTFSLFRCRSVETMDMYQHYSFSNLDYPTRNVNDSLISPFVCGGCQNCQKFHAWLIANSFCPKSWDINQTFCHYLSSPSRLPLIIYDLTILVISLKKMKSVKYNVIRDHLRQHQRLRLSGHGEEGMHKNDTKDDSSVLKTCF